MEQSVARQVHNLKVVGSNPTPAPNYLPFVQLDRTRDYGSRNEGSNPLWEASAVQLFIRVREPWRESVGKAVSQYLSQFPNILSCVGEIK